MTGFEEPQSLTACPRFSQALLKAGGRMLPGCGPQAPQITWPKGRVRIDATLRLPTPRAAWSLGVAVIFPRASLKASLESRFMKSIPLSEHAETAAREIAGALDTYAWGLTYPDPHVKPSRARQAIRTGPFRCLGVGARLRLSREEGRGFYRASAAGSVREISSEILFQLPIADALEQILHGRPRGAKAKSRPLLRAAAAALFVADRLVRSAALDRALSRRIERLDLDGDLSTPRAQAMALVDRALDGAWERFRVQPLHERSATEAYHDLLPPAHKKYLEVHLDHVAEAAWARRLLHETPGRAAQEFGLI